MKTLAEIKDYERFRHFDLAKTYTCDEFEELVRAAFACDLLYGKIIDWGIGDFRAATVRMNVLRQLYRYNWDEQWGIELSGVSVRFFDDTNLAPNLALWSNARRPPREDASVKVVPDLAIEVMTSPQVREDWWEQFVREKIKVYKGAGVKLIWLIESEDEHLEVHRPHSPQPVAILKPGMGAEGELRGEEVLPGFKMALSDLFDFD